METYYFLFINGNITMFLSYLWGMETWIYLPDWPIIRAVLILPMRNGNPPFNALYISIPQRSYPTYEEWKRLESGLSQSKVTVLILPMRNGNAAYLAQCSFANASSYPTYEEWKQPYQYALNEEVLTVLILPMRNGNQDYTLKEKMAYRVLILPMRNGNSTSLKKPSKHDLVLILPMRNGNYHTKLGTK